ncbi:RNA-guided endonuclease InsQ/TnpB family protein [Streptomyces griseorubiginosus]|uniref:RNA-guided endonuclease InsQ/TnpB family protein n=1 Tax=Streptomyces griseorubiginosus TaxID=67304 RepID=UPI001AD710D5|nr:RNA-guided endonuclease TnpB family protein [Streptomyces griseorubiginosus]MBO4257505.1 transposase [Streptomyces griseorubiginosus]
MGELGLVKRQFGHRARLALSPAEIRLIDDQAHAARTLWNCLHPWWQMTPKSDTKLSLADAAIRQARKDLDYLAVLPAQAAQAVLKTYLRAWVNCWEGRASEPAYKGRFRSAMSVDIPQGRDLNIVRVHRRWGMVNLPKVGRVRFRWTKDLPVGKRADTDNRITGARLVKDALGWHIAFRVQSLDRVPEPHRGPEVGIDAGVNIPLALSNQDHQDHGRPPRLPDGTADRDKWLTPKEKAKLLRLERQAAHRKSFRKRGEMASRRLRHTYDQIKQLRAKATRRAMDWQHQTTTYLARTYGVLVVERLNILGMTKAPQPKPDLEQPGVFLHNGARAKAGLNRAIAQEAWGRTVTMLTYKSARYGGRLVQVPAPHTSQRCSACGFTTPSSRESQELFACKNPACGWTANADWNAARNIVRLYRIGHVIVEVPAAGRRGRRAGKTVKPAAAM